MEMFTSFSSFLSYIFGLTKWFYLVIETSWYTCFWSSSNAGVMFSAVGSSLPICL